MTVANSNNRNASIHLPAMLMLGLGAWLVVWPMIKDIRLYHQRAAHHGNERTRAAAIAAARDEAARATKLADEKAAKLDSAPTFDSREAMKKLSGLCAQHQLTLASATPEPGMEKLPGSFRALAAKAGAAGDVKVWKVELSGPYAGMTGLVSGLGEGTPVVVPLSVAMRPSQSSGRPAVWTLYLWL